MSTLHAWGRGGRHRNTAEARRFRELATHIATNIREAHPRMYPGIVVLHAFTEAEHVTWTHRRVTAGRSFYDSLLETE